MTSLGHPRYRQDRLIAVGGMGEVWAATDTLLDRQVAVKVLKREYADDATFRARFETEAKHAAALTHPNVAGVLDYGEMPADAETGGPARPYLVMELVRGEPLSALLAGGRALEPARAAELIAQAATGIAAAHALGIVHRDVKPGNLLVTPDGTVKVTDFGIARVADAVPLTVTGQVIGTPHYLAPEQAEGKQSTPLSDVYSLGVVLYECLAGVKPFTADSPVTVALMHVRDPAPDLPTSVPEHLRAVVARCLDKDPANRPQSAAAMAEALRGGALPAAAAPATAVLAGAGADATRTLAAPAAPPPAARSSRGARSRRPSPVLLGVAALALLLIGVLAATALLGDDGGSTAGPTAPTGSPSAAASEPSQQATSEPAASSAPPSSEAPPETETVTVDESDYLGDPVDDAESRLEDLGLEPTSTERENPGDEEPDTVASVSPTGEVEKGSEITLEYWGDPVPVVEVDPGNDAKPSKEPKPEKTKGPGNGEGNG